MPIVDAVVLGMVQGITEFLPVSSTAHTMLFTNLLSLYPFSKSFDVILNIGTLIAIGIFFHTDCRKLFSGGIDFLRGSKTPARDFFLLIVLVNLPTIVVFGIAEILGFEFHSVPLMAANLVVFGIILYLCDCKPINKKNISFADAMKVGYAQVLSLFPGVSRLGICLSMCRYLGYDRSESFKFSVLMSMVSASGACVLKLPKLFNEQETLFFCYVAGVASALIFGLISIQLVFGFLKSCTFLPMIIYRIAFGLFVMSSVFFR